RNVVTIVNSIFLLDATYIDKFNFKRTHREALFVAIRIVRRELVPFFAEEEKFGDIRKCKIFYYKDSECFKYLCARFPSLSYETIKTVVI
ncbi:hypothetical protein L9F63_019056, partial [Diploptera punctata]